MKLLKMSLLCLSLSMVACGNSSDSPKESVTVQIDSGKSGGDKTSSSFKATGLLAEFQPNSFHDPRVLLGKCYKVSKNAKIKVFLDGSYVGDGSNKGTFDFSDGTLKFLRDGRHLEARCKAEQVMADLFPNPFFGYSTTTTTKIIRCHRSGTAMRWPCDEMIMGRQCDFEFNCRK